MRRLILFIALLWPFAWAVSAADRVPYHVLFTGLEEGSPLVTLLEKVSESKARTDQPPPSSFLLAQRGRKDLEQLEAALRSRGYLDGRVDLLPITEEKPPYTLRFKVTTGTMYRLARVDIEALPGYEGYTPPLPDTLGLKQGEAAQSRSILDAQEQLIVQSRSLGYPFAHVEGREAWAQPKNHTLDLTFRINPGPQVTLGSPTLIGNKDVDPAFLQRRIPWQVGVSYHPERMVELRQALVTTGLFRQVRIQLPKQPAPDGHWSPQISLEDKPRRTIRAGGSWHSDQGPRVHASWAHRNYFGAGENVSFTSQLSSDQQLLKANYTKPDFGQRRRTLRVSTILERAQEEAYDRTGLDVEGGLLWPWRQPYDLSFGVKLGMTTLEDLSSNQQDNYATLTLPIGLSADATDDPLDAVEGYRMGLELAPVVKLVGDATNYLRVSGHTSGYWKLQAKPRLVLAGRLQVGMALGAEYSAMPVDRRFYVGGGGTLRGYGHQLAGPLDGEYLPIGGRSMLVINSEVRYRVVDKVGMVAFVDAGRAYASAIPDGSADPLIGVGLGVRYASPLGPFRLDIGVPTKQRQGIDDPFQIYLSIGQAF
ncbi:autotransporter assembly complex protein TamA [Magnetococcus sp. PR-3]|uniref:autotransporter assembly complex protein TamA n=1 Tax=Magnetococcus sp. PR-3 TaxID=3120355 RepID=UPI002FCE5A53